MDERHALADVDGGLLVVGGEDLRAAQDLEPAFILEGAHQEAVVAARDRGPVAAEILEELALAEVGAGVDVGVGVGHVGPLDAEFGGGIEGDLGEEHLDEHLGLGLVELLDELADLVEVAGAGRDEEAVAVGFGDDADLAVEEVLGRADAGGAEDGGDALEVLLEEGSEGGFDGLRARVLEAVHLSLALLGRGGVEGADDLGGEGDVVFGAADQEAVGTQVDGDGEGVFLGGTHDGPDLIGGGSALGRRGVGEPGHDVLDGLLGAGGGADGLQAEQAGEELGHLAGIGVLEVEHLDGGDGGGGLVQVPDDLLEEAHVVERGGDDEGVGAGIGDDDDALLEGAGDEALAAFGAGDELEQGLAVRAGVGEGARVVVEHVVEDESHLGGAGVLEGEDADFGDAGDLVGVELADQFGDAFEVGFTGGDDDGVEAFVDVEDDGGGEAAGAGAHDAAAAEEGLEGLFDASGVGLGHLEDLDLRAAVGLGRVEFVDEGSGHDEVVVRGADDEGVGPAIGDDGDRLGRLSLDARGRLAKSRWRVPWSLVAVVWRRAKTRNWVRALGASVSSCWIICSTASKLSRPPVTRRVLVRSSAVTVTGAERWAAPVAASPVRRARKNCSRTVARWDARACWSWKRRMSPAPA
ncbi:MAG: hypothetical protein M5U12_31960 [Verrucomicrobia bacterium]|nr:hypothetical protein [Verrucomicrobiota bacterium]